MLIVASLGINTEMPDMDSCLKARAAISSQDESIKSLCIPKQNETDKMKEMFEIFINIVNRLKEMEYNEGTGGEGELYYDSYR